MGVSQGHAGHSREVIFIMCDQRCETDRLVSSSVSGWIRRSRGCWHRSRWSPGGHSLFTGLLGWEFFNCFGPVTRGGGWGGRRLLGSPVAGDTEMRGWVRQRSPSILEVLPRAYESGHNVIYCFLHKYLNILSTPL